MRAITERSGVTVGRPLPPFAGVGMPSRSAATHVIAILLVLLAPALASAQDVAQGTQYRVREGDTCGSIARRVYGNSRRYDLIHQANPSLGAMPHNLQPGTLLTLPRADGSAGADAMVTAVRREVASQSPQAAAQWSRAQVGQELGQGWRVNTEDRSSAELTFRSSSVVAIRERTLVIVYGGNVREDGGGSSSGTRATVREGSMLSRLSALSGGEPLEVETPSAQATLRNGETSVDVDREGTTRVAVHEGEAATVRGGRGSVEVPAGMGTKVQRGRPPSRPRRLPSPPRWRDGAPRRFVAVGDHGATVRAAWSPAPGASRYRVELARRADGRDLIFATEVGAEVTEVELRRLPAGTYFARLATIDDDRFEGRPGEGVELTVLEAQVLAPGASAPSPRRPLDPLAAGLAELDSGLADLDFESLPDSPAEVIQHSALALEGVECAAGESAPAASVVLGALGDVSVACSDGGEPIASLIVRVHAAPEAPIVAEAPVVSEEAPPPVEEPRYRPHALHEGLGLAAFASWVGLRDERRRGSGMHLAITGQSAAEGDADALLRVSAGLRASLLEERLRLDVAVPLDAVGSQARSAQRGSRDLYAAASSLVLDDRERGLGLAAEVGVWIPTAGADGLDRGRLSIALDGSLRFLDERLAVRTRQAGLFDLTEGGSLLWASAYGFDVWIAGPLSAGLEVSLVMGREDARDWIAAGVGAGVALDLDVVVISLAGRYGFGDDAILGRGLLSAAVRGTYDL